MPKKNDLSIGSALTQLTEFFFDIADSVTDTTKEPTNERSREPVDDSANDEPVKPTKRVSNTFIAKKKGSTTKSKDGADDSAGDEDTDEPDDK